MSRHQRASSYDQTAVRRLREGYDGVLNLGSIAHVHWGQLYPECRRHGLNSSKLADASGNGGIAKHPYTHHARHNLFEKLKPLPADAVFISGKTGDVSAGSGQAIHDTSTNRVRDDGEHDRDS